MPSTTSKRSSSVVKVWLSPSSTSVAMTAPTTAPDAFSSTAPSAAEISGASLTSLTVTVTSVLAERPPASVTVTVTVTVSAISWSRLASAFN